MTSTPAGGGSQSEAGFSLLEVMLTVAIMGIAFVALLAGMATSAQSAGLHRTQAVAELEVRRYAELVGAATWNPSGTYSVAGVPTADAGAAPFSLVADPVTCVDASNPASPCGSGVQVQLLTLGVRSFDLKVRESVQVIKRVP